MISNDLLLLIRFHHSTGITVWLLAPELWFCAETVNLTKSGSFISYFSVIPLQLFADDTPLFLSNDLTSPVCCVLL